METQISLVGLLFLAFYIQYIVLVAGGEDTLVDAIRLNLTTQQSPPVDIPVRLFVPVANISSSSAHSEPFAAVIFAHGSGGLYRNDDPQDVINENFRRWANLALEHQFVALFFDSYTARGGKSNADSTLIRPYDVYACVDFLISSALHTSYIPNGIRSDAIYLIGWSHGGTATLSAMSQSLNTELAYALNAANNAIIKSAFAFYPGCGMDSGYGGISRSTYCPYAPTYILAAEYDDLYTGGNCDARVARLNDINCTQPLQLRVYAGADHGFDQAEEEDIGVDYTLQDFQARNEADAFIWNVMDGTDIETNTADVATSKGVLQFWAVGCYILCSVVYLLFA